ncbi:myozenin-2-like [Paramormyrops kingsleyae]|uniref:Myozenin 3a n=1 Tax=Paramormyrops kingsleyae TaxID=1676925 RepID=A0A3B3SDF6_9TELE|nr:myozenin-2-like [Paramormyrops kingsleyae]XP_023649135.1 myozenin-2-like [Paramormyrops kingsleyae]
MQMQTPYGDLTRQKKQQAMILSKEARGEHLDLGKKISIPRDLQMEELNLQSNRGSRMFLERQRRVEKFTLENAADASGSHLELNQTRESQGILGGKENIRTELIIQPGRHNLASALNQASAKKGNPGTLAPGYSGPLKEIPREKFNMTVIPKSYCSPWREALGNNEELLNTLNTQIPEPPQNLQPVNYRCFNRAPVPFGGPVRMKVISPIQVFERQETPPEPSKTWDRLAHRPNFNRAPRGWGKLYAPESNEL